eukprot:3992390-Prymnesium_polylepis.1
MVRTGTCHVQHICTADSKPLSMKVADLERLRESGLLQSFCKRTTDGHATNFVRGRRLDAAG